MSALVCSGPLWAPQNVIKLAGFYARTGELTLPDLDSKVMPRRASAAPAFCAATCRHMPNGSLFSTEHTGMGYI